MWLHGTWFAAAADNYRSTTKKGGENFPGAPSGPWFLGLGPLGGPTFRAYPPKADEVLGRYPPDGGAAFAPLPHPCRRPTECRV
eukprot:365266-Chlamydomonas_euryale.AAC.1